VGRGKSFLMDAFYRCVPLVRKRRVHFHHFMREIHRELDLLKGTEDPIAAVAERTARRTRLIQLYPNGLQRERFLPTIELLKQRLDVLQVDNGTDYRRLKMQKLKVYHVGQECGCRAALHLAGGCVLR
jgi:cell division protein ZapE